MGNLRGLGDALVYFLGVHCVAFMKMIRSSVSGQVVFSDQSFKCVMLISISMSLVNKIKPKMLH